MSRRRDNLVRNVFDRMDDISKDARRAGRRTFNSKKRKKGGSRKWAKRNNDELQALTEQVALLVNHLSTRSVNGATEKQLSDAH
jgi:hypothetical protein